MNFGVLAGLTVGAAIVLTGCGSTTSEQAVVPSPTQSQSSTKQFASVVAQNQPALDRNATALESCAEDNPASRSCKTPAEYEVADTMNFVTDLVNYKMPAPDPEVRLLHANSLRAAWDAHDACSGAGTVGDKQNYGIGSTLCASAARSLVDTLNGWKPYGG